MEVLLSMLKDKFKDLELTRRHLADIIKDNYVSLKLTHNIISSYKLIYKLIIYE